MDDLWQVAMPNEYLLRVLAEAVLAVFIAAWSIRNLRSGRWAIVAVAGSLSFAGIDLIYLVAYAAPAWLDMHTDLLPWVFNHSSVLDWTRILGLGLFLVGVTVVRPPAKLAGESSLG